MTALLTFDQDTRRKLATLVTEVFAPAQVAGALLVVVALHSTVSLLAGVGWAALTVLVVCVLPYAFVVRQVRRQQLTDRHVRQREQRPLPLLVSLASIVAGFALLIVLGAPRELLALLVGMTVGAVVCLLITLVWKLSIHTGTVAATGLILAILFGPQLLFLELVAVLVGWARAELGVHTAAQVIGGGLIGAVIAPGIFLLLR